MLNLLASFCARPFRRAQIFHTDKVYSSDKPVLFNTTFYPVREITANTQRFMQCPGARDIGFASANLTWNNRDNIGKVIIAMFAQAGGEAWGGLRIESAFFEFYF